MSHAKPSPDEHSGHEHHHDHGHGHSHDHAPTVTADSEKRVRWALMLTASFMIAEIIGGWLSGSLALLADAGHMFSDSASLGMALVAFRLGARAPDQARTFGYQRFQVLAAFINGLTLFAIAIWIVWSAIGRLLSPVEVLAGPMMTVAVIGLLVNILSFAILHRGDSGNINLRGAAMHVMGDLLGSVAAIAAALIIMFTGWYAADPILSMLAAVLILRAAWQILRRSTHTLLEGTPDGFEVAEIQRVLLTIEGVDSLHDLHVWGLTPQDPLVSLHLVVQEGVEHQPILRQAYKVLHETFGISHATLQIEGKACLTGGACEPAINTPDDATPTHTAGAR